MQLDQPGIIFKYSFLTLLCVSSVILTYAENYLFPQILGLPIILLTFTFVDKKQVLNVNPTIAAFLGLIAVSLGFLEFLFGGIEARILSASHLVSYLLWITLLQNKTPREYWWMTALTVMQVSVASVLTSDGFFGVGMLVYLFLIIWTLAFFSVYRAALRIRSATSQIQTTLISAPQLSNTIERKTFIKAIKSTARGSIHLNPGEPWISWQFFGGVTVITLLSLFVAGLFFVFTPRIWLGKISFPSDMDEPGSKNVSGFTESVRLGEMGNIMENPAAVFNVKIIDSSTNKAITPEEFCTNYGMDAPLFRGCVMTQYSNSKWSMSNDKMDANRQRDQNRNFSYSCDYEQLQTTGNFLFSLGLFGEISETSESIGAITHDLITGVVKSSYPGKLNYRHVIYPSIVIKDHLCTPVPPDALYFYLSSNYLSNCSRFSQIRLQKIFNYTNQLIVAEETRLQKSMTHLEIAFFLEKHLQSSGQFSYSLNQSVSDSSIDPVEDFLINRKSGHCEYFSSALALMLRSRGIPTRLISGFKGGNYNIENKTIEVKQLHAHAWLEFFDLENRQWITLDPTPSAARETQIAEIQSNLNSGESVYSQVMNYWNNYVVNVSYEQQQRLLYNPMYDVMSSSWKSLKGVRNFARSSWEIVVEVLSDPKQLFSVKGFVLVTGLGAIAVFIWFLFHKIIPSVKQSILLKSQASRSDSKILFFEHYLQLLRKLHLVRQEQQTPLELTLAAGKMLQEKSVLIEQIPFLEDVTLAYYHIRFGNYQLSDQEQKDWLTKISQLDEKINQMYAKS